MSEEIEQLIRSHAGPVVVLLVEPFLDAEKQMDWLAAAMKQWRADARVVSAQLSLHREWARQYRVFGSPCTLIFQEGALRVRVRGCCSQQRLREILGNAGLFRPFVEPSDDP